ncbi:hypothetical protein OG402_38495 [Streptomyces anulatus]|uniref:hypothetical protein n=1 Tax=Streptomyces anulatus TaxID=1892 RepID=UPI00225B8F6E|nr:hypothetical protein [Streptomyces anulatus]MCX4523324.1 hypothetical protein [Streptomyces anulatus]MCX4606334.1 hypothetical protein [Streptomyces anulatus]
MPQISKVELYAAIRRDHRAGMKMRELERKYNVSWRTAKKAVDSVWPEPRKKFPPRPTALDPYKPVIDEMRGWGRRWPRLRWPAAPPSPPRRESGWWGIWPVRSRPRWPHTAHGLPTQDTELFPT